MTAITLLDGAIGQELVRRSGDRATPLWSTSVMIDHPDLVGRLHADYFAAGATIATANTYALHRSRLARVGLADRLPALLDAALTQAEAARAAHGTGRIAASLGPLLASYRPDLDPDPAKAAALFGEIVDRVKSRADLLLIETVSSIREGEGALRATAGSGKPVWIAFSTADDDGTRLRSGEPLADARALIDRHAPDAVLINCTRPEVVADALTVIAPFGLPFGAYANGFTHISAEFLKDAPTVDALDRRTDLGPQAYADTAMGWVAQGATILGGCCEIGPAHIAELARRLTREGHAIT